MNKIILVGNLGREPQKKVPASTFGRRPAGEASTEAHREDGRDLHRNDASNARLFFDPPKPDAKTVSTLAAKCALLGRELRVIEKPGGRAYYEVRRWDGECYMCSTLHDVAGIAARTQHARPVAGMARSKSAAFIEGLRADYGLDCVLAASIAACREQPIGPASWLRRQCQHVLQTKTIHQGELS